jgi:succinylglutamate desuccinylase
MNLLNLKILKEVPDFLIKARISELQALLGGPTLIHLEGENKKPLFISTLLHGNEHSGFMAIQKLLQDFQKRPLKRSLIIFIGNTMAAESGHRHLVEQVDFNRVWNGGSCELAQVASSVLDYVKDYQLFASVDIHNNTGKNPYYGCINKIDDQFFFLAKFFFDRIVYFTEPHEVQSMAFAQLCPSITIEAGNSGEERGIEILVQKIKALLELDEIPNKIDRTELEVFHTVARMKFANSATIDFENNPNSTNDFSLLSNIDTFNFRELSSGTILGKSNGAKTFWVEDHPTQNLFDEFFEIKDNELKVKKAFIPAMMTKDIDIIKDDCFGYIMERYPL